MTYNEVLEVAKHCTGKHCKACPVCNGRACGNQIPGPGAKGTGDTAILNYEAWQKIRLNMDTLVEKADPDPSFTLFGHSFKYPFFAGPVGAINLHYGEKYNDISYNQVLVSACAENGIAAFTGDGTDPNVMIAATTAIKNAQGIAIPTVKPWDSATISGQMAMIRDSGAFAAAMDVDAAGLPFLKGLNPPAGRKSVKELSEIIKDAALPFIVKGIMTVKGAEKAIEAGASAIVVSNHGGRVLDSCPSTASVLPEIAAAAKGRTKIFVDGGIRTGADVFKALALGADACIIARPFVLAVLGGDVDGVKAYIDKIGAELKDAMFMCGANTLDEITPEMVVCQ